MLRRRKKLYWEKRNLRETEKTVLWEDFESLNCGQLRRLIEAFRTNVRLEERRKEREKDREKTEETKV